MILRGTIIIQYDNLINGLKQLIKLSVLNNKKKYSQAIDIRTR